MTAAMAAPVAHDSRGRFSSAWRDDQLLDVLALVAQHVEPRAPTSVTMRAWDEARGRALGLVDEADFPPTARAVVMRLNSRGRRYSWRQWLQVSLTHGPQRSQALVAQQRAEELGPPSEQRIHYALNRVAVELAARTVTPDAYDAGRETLLARDRRRRRGRPGALANMLPTANQLVTGRDWPAVLAIAGLDAPKRPRSRPAGAVIIGSTSYVEAQAWFARYNGRYASRSTLRRFMADCGAALQEWPRDRPLDECYEQVAALLQEEGIPAPGELPLSGHHADRRPHRLPPDGVIPGAPPSRAARSTGRTDEERRTDLRARCIRGLHEFSVWMAAEQPGVRPTRKRYLAWRRGTDWPAPRSFDQFGGFTALLAEAQVIATGTACGRSRSDHGTTVAP